MATSMSKFLFANDIVVTPAGDAPPVTTFLETHPGAYTTTPLLGSSSPPPLQLTLDSSQVQPKICVWASRFFFLVFSSYFFQFALFDTTRVGAAMRKAIPVVFKERHSGQELAISTLICGNCVELGKTAGKVDSETVDKVLDVYLHIGMYVPSAFGSKGNGAHLAMVGRRRDLAEAKY